MFEYLVQPQEFTILRTGGPDHGFLVDAVIFQGGRLWTSLEKGKTIGRNFLRHSFNQVAEG